MKKSFTLTLLLAFITQLSAFTQSMSFRKITADNGLTCNTVFTIAQDPKGFVWFGTREGLDRYDGHTVKNYEINNPLPGIPLSRINCLFTFRDTFYAGTSNGLYQYDPVKDSVIASTQFNARVNVLAMASTGKDLFIGTGAGLYRIGELRQLLGPGFKSKPVTAIAALSQACLLVACGNSLLIMKENGRVLQQLSLLPEARHERETIYFSIVKQGRYYWIGSNDGLLRFDQQNQVLTRVPFTDKENTESNVVRAVRSGPKGQLVLGTENGLYLFEPKTGKSTHYSHSLSNDPQSLNDKAIYAAFTSNDGSIWLGTYFGGINYVPSIVYGFRNLLPGQGSQQLNGKAISQLMEDENKQIWIGTEDGGISIYDPAKQYFEHISTRTKPFYLSVNNVHAIYHDGSGSIWAGTFLGGLHRFNKRTNTTTIYRHRANSKNTLSNDHIYTIYRDSRKIL
ncbi:MAG: two-component regulator propeller domain-containing protein [Mucilaginibacter sp.]|uniref:ligand-binding sensor domain-containing protein n=1 Tax=Mucilaginibacter sp. TaxID=1882438 RepID=UPI0031A1DF3B